ncbi:anti-sigma factor family protein, partial [Streptomyces neyagawaensis]|uniref:anti-sigma factor family protein n=1 Tax=Streptomyces neyagawaensis TaxID=42238 RepID=UPI000A40D18B
MSGSRPTPAEQHLGDRLSALVDGELGHEARERVLAHLATCPKCKAEADAQRRLKNVFAEAAPPPPSESFLARLQMLPAGGDLDGGSPLDGGGFGGRLGGTPGGPGLPLTPSDNRGFADFGVFGTTGDSFGYVPSGPHSGALSPSEGRGLLGGRVLPALAAVPVGGEPAVSAEEAAVAGRGTPVERASVAEEAPSTEEAPVTEESASPRQATAA